MRSLQLQRAPPLDWPDRPGPAPCCPLYVHVCRQPLNGFRLTKAGSALLFALPFEATKMKKKRANIMPDFPLPLFEKKAISCW